MSEMEDIDELSSETAHNKLSTPLGRWIEKITYLHVGVLALFAIFSSATYFFFAAGGENGLDKDGGKCFVEALYFSIVTFSTVGYGDFAPQGWGRLIAGLEIIAGISLTALFIGKVASERQSALLLLLYTSDQQRRISKFALEIRAIRASLGENLPSSELVKSSKQLTRSLRAYLVFQSHQGRLADFGNGSALRNLYKALLELQGEIYALLNRVSLLDAACEIGLVEMSARLARLAEIMGSFHLGQRGPTADLYAIRKIALEIEAWQKTSHTVHRQEQVKSVVPSRPWPKHFHKAAADRLGISRNLFRECMDVLIKMKRI